MITCERLLDMDEARLRRDVLVPLFREMGFRDVFEYHGQAMEQGKDIVTRQTYTRIRDALANVA